MARLTMADVAKYLQPEPPDDPPIDPDGESRANRYLEEPPSLLAREQFDDELNRDLIIEPPPLPNEGPIDPDGEGRANRYLEEPPPPMRPSLLRELMDDEMNRAGPEVPWGQPPQTPPPVPGVNDLQAYMIAENLGTEPGSTPELMPQGDELASLLAWVRQFGESEPSADSLQAMINRGRMVRRGLPLNVSRLLAGAQ